jgi:hypothetical protein
MYGESLLNKPPVPKPLPTFHPGDKVSVTTRDDTTSDKRRRVAKKCAVIKDYGNFVLLQLPHYKECFMKDDLVEGWI